MSKTQSEAIRLAYLFDNPLPPEWSDMVAAAATLRRLDAENKVHKNDIMSFHYAMKDAGWHPGRTDDLLTDIIRAKGQELIQANAENFRLRAALDRARAWMDRQADSQSGGNHATFDLMMLREERDAITIALQSAEVHPVNATRAKQFLADVHTAAGLVAHGNRCKALSERLSDGCMHFLSVLASPPFNAEAIKAEFLERTGQYLTNDASREACIAEAVAEAANADTARLDWMEQHDGRYYNHDRIACIVGTGFLIGSLDQVNREHDTLRGAIDAARAAQAKEGGESA